MAAVLVWKDGRFVVEEDPNAAPSVLPPEPKSLAQSLLDKLKGMSPERPKIVGQMKAKKATDEGHALRLGSQNVKDAIRAAQQAEQTRSDAGIDAAKQNLGRALGDAKALGLDPPEENDWGVKPVLHDRPSPMKTLGWLVGRGYDAVFGQPADYLLNHRDESPTRILKEFGKATLNPSEPPKMVGSLVRQKIRETGVPDNNPRVSWTDKLAHRLMRGLGSGAAINNASDWEDLQRRLGDLDAATPEPTPQPKYYLQGPGKWRLPEDTAAVGAELLTMLGGRRNPADALTRVGTQTLGKGVRLAGKGVAKAIDKPGSHGEKFLDSLQFGGALRRAEREGGIGWKEAPDELLKTTVERQKAENAAARGFTDPAKRIPMTTPERIKVMVDAGEYPGLLEGDPATLEKLRAMGVDVSEYEKPVNTAQSITAQRVNEAMETARASRLAAAPKATPMAEPPEGGHFRTHVRSDLWSERDLERAGIAPGTFDPNIQGREIAQRAGIPPARGLRVKKQHSRQLFERLNDAQTPKDVRQLNAADRRRKGFDEKDSVLTKAQTKHEEAARKEQERLRKTLEAKEAETLRRRQERLRERHERRPDPYARTEMTPDEPPAEGWVDPAKLPLRAGDRFLPPSRLPGKPPPLGHRAVAKLRANEKRLADASPRARAERRFAQAKARHEAVSAQSPKLPPWEDTRLSMNSRLRGMAKSWAEEARQAGDARMADYYERLAAGDFFSGDPSLQARKATRDAGEAPVLRLLDEWAKRGKDVTDLAGEVGENTLQVGGKGTAEGWFVPTRNTAWNQVTGGRKIAVPRSVAETIESTDVLGGIRRRGPWDSAMKAITGPTFQVPDKLRPYFGSSFSPGAEFFKLPATIGNTVYYPRNKMTNHGQMTLAYGSKATPFSPTWWKARKIRDDILAQRNLDAPLPVAKDADKLRERYAREWGLTGLDKPAVPPRVGDLNSSLRRRGMVELEGNTRMPIGSQIQSEISDLDLPDVPRAQKLRNRLFFLKPSQSTVVQKVADKLGRSEEEKDRVLAAVIGALQTGDARMGERLAEKIVFNPQASSPLLHSLSEPLPFVRWWGKNVPLQFRLLENEPYRLRSMLFGMPEVAKHAFLDYDESKEYERRPKGKFLANVPHFPTGQKDLAGHPTVSSMPWSAQGDLVSAANIVNRTLGDGPLAGLLAARDEALSRSMPSLQRIVDPTYDAIREEPMGVPVKNEEGSTVGIQEDRIKATPNAELLTRLLTEFGLRRGAKVPLIGTDYPPGQPYIYQDHNERRVMEQVPTPFPFNLTQLLAQTNTLPTKQRLLGLAGLRQYPLIYEQNELNRGYDTQRRIKHNQKISRRITRGAMATDDE